MNKKIKINTTQNVTQKELENGLWQFMMDHAVPFEKGLWQVKYLPITTKEDLMRRIYSRATNLYKIKDEEKIEKELEKRIGYLQSLLVGAKISKKKQSDLNNLLKKSKWKHSVVVYLHMVANKLTKMWCNEI